MYLVFGLTQTGEGMFALLNEKREFASRVAMLCPGLAVNPEFVKSFHAILAEQLMKDGIEVTKEADVTTN